MRGGSSIAALPPQLRKLESDGVALRFVFLDARDEVLIQRFSETRRRHPLAGDDVTLEEAIAREREALEMLASLGHHIDTSNLRPNALRASIKDFAALDERSGLVLLFESFGFKHGIPLDADLVFDVRCLPNPHYDPALRPLTGRDAEVIRFLEAQPEVARMEADLRRFIGDWLPAYVRDNRSYLTVGIGCTGGQHRSVYLAERLAAHFRGVGAGAGAAPQPDRMNERLPDGLRELLRRRRWAPGTGPGARCSETRRLAAAAAFRRAGRGVLSAAVARRRGGSRHRQARRPGGHRAGAQRGARRTKSPAPSAPR
jgi:UPF0042 nucleotide-binding protein